MGKLDSIIGFTGSIGNLTAYRRKGSDKIIIQRKGGPSRRQLKTSPAYARGREITTEFAGQSRMASRIHRAMQPLKSLGNDATFGILTSMMMPIQQNDKISKKGQRHVLLTSKPTWMEGFQLNTLPVEKVLRPSLTYSLSREQRSAHVIIPELTPGMNLVVPEEYPWYRIMITLGIVPDMFWTELRYEPSHDFYSRVMMNEVSSPWALSAAVHPGITLDVQLDNVPPNESYTLMLCIGVLFGKTGPGGNPTQVPKAGCAKVLLMQ